MGVGADEDVDGSGNEVDENGANLYPLSDFLHSIHYHPLNYPLYH